MINKKLLNLLWFAYIAALILWLLLTYGDTAKAFLDGRYFAYEKDGDIYTCDFILYYNNGILAWEAFKNHINIYDGLLQNQYLEKLTGLELKKIFYSQYPPYLFVLMMPLPLADMSLDWVLWELGAMALMLYSLWGLLKISLEGKFTRTFAIVAAIASFPAWICFRLGQIALLIYPAFIWYWLMLERQKW
ncbi:MAG TPA: glycosyltransferase family 87 protein, partial [Candidatus Melainabacteria bacterium]|nr:glycosyltransferase family 87 protein [Candidatus Melainabacteria bacterium]